MCYFCAFYHIISDVIETEFKVSLRFKTSLLYSLEPQEMVKIVKALICRVLKNTACGF